jgi:hypothetical protein
MGPLTPDGLNGAGLMVIHNTTRRLEGLNGDTAPQEPRGPPPAPKPSLEPQTPGRLGPPEHFVFASPFGPSSRQCISLMTIRPAGTGKSCVFEAASHAAFGGALKQ